MLGLRLALHLVPIWAQDGSRSTRAAAARLKQVEDPAVVNLQHRTGKTAPFADNTRHAFTTSLVYTYTPESSQPFGQNIYRRWPVFREACSKGH